MRNEASKRRVTPEAFEEKVKVIILAQGAAPEVGHRPGHALFTLRTHGMPQFKRKELEVVDVPALWVPAAGDFLNGWALYTVNHRPIKPGETLTGGFNHNVLVRAAKVGKVLRLQPEAVKMGCSCCGGAV